MPQKGKWLQNSLILSQIALGSEHEGHIPTPGPLPTTNNGEIIGPMQHNPETGDLRVIVEEQLDDANKNTSSPHPT